MRLIAFRRVAVLLLASGASAIALNANVSAAPFNAVVLSPSVLFPVSDRTTAAPARAVNMQASRPTFANLQTPADRRGSLNTDLKLLILGDAQTSSRLFDGNSLSFGSTDAGGQSLITVRRTRLTLRPTLDATFDRLTQGIQFGLPPGDAANSGIDADLFDGRLKLSSDITMAKDPVKPLGLRPGEDVNSTGGMETAFQHSFAAKVVDHDRFKWSLAGQMGQIDPRFADFIFTEPGDKSPALQWSSLSTRMDFGPASLSVAYDGVTRLDQVENHRSLTLGFNQSALSIYRRDASQFSLDQGGHWLRRTAVTGASVEVIIADVLPNKVAEVLSPVVPFLPNTISASYEVGDALRPDGPGTGTPVEHVRSMSADLTWNTRFGETTASYWQREIKANADKLRLETANDRVVDLSHSIKRGNWRFGAGVSFIESGDETLTTRSRESRIAPHVSFAYEAEDFPTIEVRLGAADARSIVGVDDIPASAKARQLQISLDLSNFVQNQLNKPEAKLKLEYRRELENADSNLGGRFAKGGDQALLITFSTPLN